LRQTVSIRGGAHTPEPHESAVGHVTGRAPYTDDIPEPVGTLHACLGLSEVAHGRIVSMDLDAVRAAPGVVAVLTAADIPGANDISPTGLGDDPVFPADTVAYHGQPLFAVVAETREQARRAAALARIACDPLPAILGVEAALDAGASDVTPPLTLARGDAEAALQAAPHRLQGRMRIGGQDHMYLEGQIALAIPGEDGTLSVHCSTQHPAEAQQMVAQVLGLPYNAVTVQVRRMGGGFGGKETQMNLFAAVAALAASRLGRPVKLRPDRDQDMIATGKRHDFVADYDVGFDAEGRIQAVDARLAARCGFSADLSGPVTDRALFHADNGYFYPHVRLASRPFEDQHRVEHRLSRLWRAAGRGGRRTHRRRDRLCPGRGPADHPAAQFLRARARCDPLSPAGRGQHPAAARRGAGGVVGLSGAPCRDPRFNAQGGVARRGIARDAGEVRDFLHRDLVLNQAGALVHVYKDGSIG
jgi:xanthine dehydrogenase large subunit